MNWGLKIATLYIAFVVLIISMVALTMRQKVDLVAGNYYEQELNYQNKIDQSNRAKALKNPLTWQLKNDSLLLQFPSEFKKEKISGSIYFFRPSDQTMDKTIAITTDTFSMQKIATSILEKGLYKMQINWQSNQQEFYNEGIIQIN